MKEGLDNIIIWKMGHQPFVIRKARKEDISFIIEVDRSSATRDELQGFTTNDWDTYLRVDKLTALWDTENKLCDGSEIIVAEKNTYIVGFIVFKEEIDYIYIDLLNITKSEQNKGIGKTLVACVENIAIQRGIHLLKTDTTENIQGVPWKSYEFWIKMGFQDLNIRESTKWGFKQILFEKRLN